MPNFSVFKLLMVMLMRQAAKLGYRTQTTPSFRLQFYMDRIPVRLAMRLADPIDHEHALDEFEATYEDDFESNYLAPDPAHLFVPDIDNVGHGFWLPS
jgi:hypothetical protein